MKTVSVIMATGNDKPVALRNTLRSWSKVNYPIEFILVNTNGFDSAIDALVREFDFLTKYVVMLPAEDEKWARVSRIWTSEGRASHGDYVIFAMADEILGDYKVIQGFLNSPTKYRTSMLTYFLSPDGTNKLPTIDWLSNPKIVESNPDFWSHQTVQGADIIPNSQRKTNPNGATLMSHIHGAPRKHWEYMNWFREDEHGYLWLDMDVHFREVATNRLCTTLEGHVCYHQWHPLLQISDEDRTYGYYTYENVAQARLLEPAIFHGNPK